MEFAQAVEDYLGWMKANGYADSTILAHAKALKRFGKFVESARIPWPESLTYAFVRHYRQAEGPWARTDAVKGLSRFLCAKGFVRSPIEKPVRKLPEIYEDYLAYFKNARGVGDGYLDDARRLLSAFRMYLERRGLDLGRVEIEHVDEFLAGRNRRFSSSANRSNRSHLRNFFKYLRFELRIVKKDIAGLIVGATEFAQRKPPKFLRPGETELVFENLSFDDKKSCRQAAMVHLAFSLGLRPKEICSVLLDDISFVRGAIVIPKRKCDNPVELPLPEAAIKAVAAYIIGARPDSRHRHLFLALTAPYSPLSVQRASAEITAALKPVNPEATAYWLRHTYAQNMLSAGADIFEVKEMMGHDRIQSTRRYLQIDLQSMRRLFDG